MKYLKIIIFIAIVFLCISFTFQKKDKKEYREMEYTYSLIEGIKHKYIGNLKSSLALLKNSLDISDSSPRSYSRGGRSAEGN